MRSRCHFPLSSGFDCRPLEKSEIEYDNPNPRHRAGARNFLSLPTTFPGRNLRKIVQPEMDPERIIVMELETLSLEFLIISFFFRFDVPRLRDFFTTLRTINIPSFLFFQKFHSRRSSESRWLNKTVDFINFKKFEITFTFTLQRLMKKNVYCIISKNSSIYISKSKWKFFILFHLDDTLSPRRSFEKHARIEDEHFNKTASESRVVLLKYRYSSSRVERSGREPRAPLLTRRLSFNERFDGPPPPPPRKGYI